MESQHFKGRAVKILLPLPGAQGRDGKKGGGVQEETQEGEKVQGLGVLYSAYTSCRISPAAHFSVQECWHGLPALAGLWFILPQMLEADFQSTHSPHHATSMQRDAQLLEKRGNMLLAYCLQLFLLLMASVVKKKFACSSFLASLGFHWNFVIIFCQAFMESFNKC